jgi:uncharacterized membrane protein YfcA
LAQVHQLLVFLAACAGGAINSVAGGGTLLTVPTLIWLGGPALHANATSTVALWPGSLSGAWGFRHEMRQADPRVSALIVPSLIGGLTAALSLMGHTDIHQMNGLKNLLAVAINGIAIVSLLFTDLIRWDDALLMATGAIVGALIGAGTARRTGQTAVSHTVVVVGLAMALAMFVKL